MQAFSLDKEWDYYMLVISIRRKMGPLTELESVILSKQSS